jgi:hypothetical protein
MNTDDMLDHIDAAVFTGDTFHDPEERAKLMEFMARWIRELSTLQNTDENE